MKIIRHKTIAIDFDGTIVEDNYPGIGRARTFAFDTMKRLQNDGHRLILWTYRDGKLLDEAVEYCQKNGVAFYSVNKNYPEEEFDGKTIRKLNADIFIDDRNIGGFMGWGKIYQLLTQEEVPSSLSRKKSLFSFFKK